MTMLTVNLINKEKSDIPYRILYFSDGQPHIKLTLDAIDKSEDCRIICRISSANDLLLLLFCKSSLTYHGIEFIDIHISYLLTGRTDRIMRQGEPFSLKIIADIINDANFRQVFLFDPHSEVSTAVINNAHCITNHVFVKDVIKSVIQQDTGKANKAYCLVSPDAGALKKIYQLSAALDNMEVVECMKTRDPLTGALTHFKVYADSLEGKYCFLVDDICDTGDSIVGVATQLKLLGATKVISIISHAILSKGFDLANVDEIYTTNSYKEIVEHPAHVHILDVLDYL